MTALRVGAHARPVPVPRRKRRSTRMSRPETYRRGRTLLGLLAAMLAMLGVFATPATANPGKAGTQQVNAVEWGIAAIHADQVWSTFGVRGEGIVVANIDTGVDYTHPALVGKYRGNTGGGTFNHNYNWFDPAQVCGQPSL